MAYPVENLLRAPVEFILAVTPFAAAVALAGFPEVFLVSPIEAFVAASVLGMHAACRLWQAAL